MAQSLARAPWKIGMFKSVANTNQYSFVKPMSFYSAQDDTLCRVPMSR
jgi:hypothetical protein